MPGPVFLEGEDVSLRTIEEEDLEFLQETINQQAVWRGIGRPTPLNMNQEQSFYEDVVCSDETVNLLITDGETPVGTVGLSNINEQANSAELGYFVAPASQQEGYGSDAVECLVDYGFRHRGFHRIHARVFEFNEASSALLESLGFTKEGVHRESYYIDGKYQDTYWYGLLRDEWDL